MRRGSSKTLLTVPVPVQRRCRVIAFRGVAEIIQNADDTEATFVEFRIINGHLVAVHDGRPVTLSDVLSLATPWLSNKTDNVLATGRFGIGLMTLRALSEVLDVHSGPYHVRLGDPTHRNDHRRGGHTRDDPPRDHDLYDVPLLRFG